MYRIPVGEQFQKMQSTRVYIQSLIDSTTLQMIKTFNHHFIWE